MIKLTYRLMIPLLMVIMMTGFAAADDFPPEDFQKVVLLFTNDVHGGIARVEARFMNPEFPPLIGNGPALAAYVKALRTEAGRNNWGVLLTDAGDFYSGTPVGTLSKGRAVVDFMNSVGYDAMAVGNHDFDKGRDALAEDAGLAHFPFLAANIVESATGTQPDWIKPWIIRDIAGIKFGIIGIATSSTPSMSFPDNIRGLEFLPEIPVLQKAVPELKRAGAQIVIVLSHMWLEYERDQTAQALFEKGYDSIDPNAPGVDGMEAAAAVPGIDIMFTGHVHKGFPTPYEDPIHHTLIFQNFANGSNLGQVNIYVHRRTATLAGYDFAVDGNDLITLMEDEFWIDPGTDSVISAEVAEAETGFDEILTVLKSPLRRSSEGQSVLGNMVVDAMREAGSADIAFSNFGGIRADLEAGPLTPRDLFQVLPYGNKLTVFQVSGEFIKSLIEDRVQGASRGMLVSGAVITVDKARENGDRVSIDRINGQPFDAAKTYRLAISDYLAEGNSGYDLLTSVPAAQINYSGIVIRQALIEYITRTGVDKSGIDNRWTVLK